MPRTSKIMITKDLQELYERERRLDTDPEASTLPPEMWEKAVIGKFYRPLKTAVSVRIDNDVLAWLKSQGEGHLTRINEILRHAMNTGLKR
jgi:uncharacterized protein (DUF4415 family)